MNTAFIGNENKGLIWQLLTEANAFANIPDMYFTQVKQVYENVITDVAKLKETTLTEKNKMVITEMMKQLSYFKKFINKKQENQLRPLEEVQIEVNKDYENKKEEFIKLVNHKTPSEISFNDKNDTPLDSTIMNNLLNSMMQSREQELNQIHPEKHSNTLEEQTNTLEEQTNTLEEQTNTLEEQTNTLEEQTNTISTGMKKKVTFINDDFISRLKKIENPSNNNPTKTNDIKSILNTIITTQRSNIVAQEEMLNHLITLQNNMHL